MTICILDPVGGTLECGRADGTEFTLPLPLIPTNQTFVCLDSDDARALLRACTKGEM